jgi:hypothetical protein
MLARSEVAPSQRQSPTLLRGRQALRAGHVRARTVRSQTPARSAFRPSCKTPAADEEGRVGARRTFVGHTRSCVCQSAAVERQVENSASVCRPSIWPPIAFILVAASRPASASATVRSSGFANSSPAPEGCIRVSPAAEPNLDRGQALEGPIPATIQRCGGWLAIAVPLALTYWRAAAGRSWIRVRCESGALAKAGPQSPTGGYGPG